MTKKQKTAAELLAELDGSPSFRAMCHDREVRLRTQQEEFRAAEAPLVQALREAGEQVESVWDLVNRRTRRYPRAVPILLAHFDRGYPDRIREGIARALTVSDAQPHWRTLVRLYCNEHSPEVKDGLAAALAGIATIEFLPDVIELLRDGNLGPSRILLLSALARSRDERARQSLMELGGHPEFKEEVQAVFKRKRRWSRTL